MTYGGSNPSRCIYTPVAKSGLKQATLNRKIEGSNPSRSTMKKLWIVLFLGACSKHPSNHRGPDTIIDETDGGYYTCGYVHVTKVGNVHCHTNVGKGAESGFGEYVHVFPKEHKLTIIYSYDDKRDTRSKEQ